jgi:hypothetical protein
VELPNTPLYLRKILPLSLALLVLGLQEIGFIPETLGSEK